MSRNIKGVLAIILAALFVFQVSVIADEYEAIEAAVAYSVEKAEITVSAVANGNTVITVVPAGTELEKVGDDNAPVIIRVLTSYGHFSDTVVVPDTVKGGKYTVYVSTSYGEDSADFVYINLDEANETVGKINGAETYKELEKILVDNAIKIGIDSEDNVFKTHTSSFAKMLIKKDYADIIEFSDTYFEIYPLLALREKDADGAALVMRQHAARLGIDYEEEIENEDRLSEDEKDDLFIYMTRYDFEGEYGEDNAPTFKETLNAYKPLAAINGVENWVDLKKVITEDFAENYANLLGDRKYKGLKDEDKVFEIMMKYNYSSPEKIEEKLEVTIKERYKKENESTSAGGSSGGSSGGSFGGSSGGFTASQNIPKPDFDAYKVSFGDVGEDFWGFTAIDALAADDIISGYEDGSFKPMNKITRAEFTKLIISVIEKYEIDIPEEKSEAAFDDVTENDWYFKHISTAYKKGIIMGSGSAFLPNTNIKREDAAVIIYRLMDKAGNTPAGIKAFADRDEISEYASSAISALGSIGVVSGVGDGKFMPKSSITRAEAAQLIYNAFAK